MHTRTRTQRETYGRRLLGGALHYGGGGDWRWRWRLGGWCSREQSSTSSRGSPRADGGLPHGCSCSCSCWWRRCCPQPLAPLSGDGLPYPPQLLHGGRLREDQVCLSLGRVREGREDRTSCQPRREKARGDIHSDRDIMGDRHMQWQKERGRLPASRIVSWINKHHMGKQDSQNGILWNSAVTCPPHLQ